MIGLFRLVQAILFGAVAESEGAEEKKKEDKPGARKRQMTVTGYATVQDSTLMTDAMTTWLKEQGLPRVHAMPGGGGGAAITAGRLVIDGCGGGAGDVEAIDGGELSYGGGYGAFDIGFIVAQNRFFRIYPLVGVGGMGGGASRDMTAEDDSSTSSGWGAALFRGGIGIDFMLKVWRVGVLVGLRFGYQSGAFHAQSGDGPEIDTPEGPFFRIIVGPHFVR